jgi:acyl dehydratase
LRVTVTEGHILTYAGVAGDFAPVHMDAVHAKTTEFGGRIAHGSMGLSLTDGIKVQSAVFMDGVALGWTWKFKRPIRLGDTLQSSSVSTTCAFQRAGPTWASCSLQSSCSISGVRSCRKGAPVDGAPPADPNLSRRRGRPEL